MNIDTYISNLKKADLSILPDPIVENLLKEILKNIGSFGIGTIFLEPGHEIFRARPNKHINEIFSLREELRYAPEEKNNRYLRASTPYNTMFYGALRHLEGDLIARLTIAFEVMPWIRDNISQAKQKVTYSKWVVKERIQLAAILFEPAFSQNRHVETYLSETLEYITTNFDNYEDILKLHKFISEEFSKQSIRDNYDYLISSIFTRILLKYHGDKLEGVLYPSTRVFGGGTNVAITPNAVDNKLDLVAVMECMLYKNNDNIVMDNLSSAQSFDDENLNTFKLRPLDNFGEQNCLLEVGSSYLPYI